MAGRIDAVLAEKNIELPSPSTPAANYVPFVLTGNLLHIAGQIPFWNGEKRFVGRVEAEFSIADGQQAARNCVLNILAHAKAALDGNLDRVKRVVKLGGFVACGPHFNDHPKVINGASDLLVEIFGDAGRHARFAVGAPSLPLGVAVEIDAILEVE